MTEVKHDNMDNISTKVNVEFKALFDGLCQQMGLKTYNVLQLCAEAIVLMRDETHNLSNDMRRVIRMFEGIHKCADRICLADSWEDMEIVAAVYILRNRNKAGEKMAMVEPFFGEMNCTYNTNTILERVIRIASPSFYRLMVAIMEELHTESILDAMRSVADLYKEDPMEQEILDDLGDTERMDGGRNKVGNDPRGKRTMVNSMEAFERRQTSLWTEDDQINETF